MSKLKRGGGARCEKIPNSKPQFKTLNSKLETLLKIPPLPTEKKQET